MRISSNLTTTCGRVLLGSSVPREFNVNFNDDESDADVGATCRVRAIYPEEGEGGRERGKEWKE